MLKDSISAIQQLAAEITYHKKFGVTVRTKDFGIRLNRDIVHQNASAIAVIGKQIADLDKENLTPDAKSAKTIQLTKQLATRAEGLHQSLVVLNNSTMSRTEKMRFEAAKRTPAADDLSQHGNPQIQSLNVIENRAKKIAGNLKNAVATVETELAAKAAAAAEEAEIAAIPRPVIDDVTHVGAGNNHHETTAYFTDQSKGKVAKYLEKKGLDSQIYNLADGRATAYQVPLNQKPLTDSHKADHKNADALRALGKDNAAEILASLGIPQKTGGGKTFS